MLITKNTRNCLRFLIMNALLYQIRKQDTLLRSCLPLFCLFYLCGNYDPEPAFFLQTQEKKVYSDSYLTTHPFPYDGCFSIKHIWPISSIALRHNNLWTCKFIIYQVQFGALANFKITNKSHERCISFANSIHKCLIHHKICYNIYHSKIKISLLENWLTSYKLHRHRLFINCRYT